ncbi:MAG: hypothetical protein KAS51_05070 [Candidatus Omnitrophica bacterium]|nr:hypothetical protein [Candidatus Omnitrophota bacterium]
MGRPKKELKQIHRKKVAKAKEKIKEYLNKNISYQELTVKAKKVIKKTKTKKTVVA